MDASLHDVMDPVLDGWKKEVLAKLEMVICKVNGKDIVKRTQISKETDKVMFPLGIKLQFVKINSNFSP